jgi:hypothetical protein
MFQADMPIQRHECTYDFLLPDGAEVCQMKHMGSLTVCWSTCLAMSTFESKEHTNTTTQDVVLMTNPAGRQLSWLLQCLKQNGSGISQATLSKLQVSTDISERILQNPINSTVDLFHVH